MIETIESSFIHSATSENFAEMVLANSRQGPVLVNFWSRKAEPCLRQYPILDKLVYDYKGRLLLINIEIDHQDNVTKEYGVKSVPTLKLFRDATVVETRHGYQSENDLKSMLDHYLARDSDAVIARAVQAFENGDQEQAYQLLDDAKVADPANPRLPLAVCKLLKHEQRFAEAISLIENLPAPVSDNKDIVHLYHMLNFHQEAEAAGAIAPLLDQVEVFPDDLESRQQLVAHYAIGSHFEKALQELVHIMDIDQHYNDNYPQRTMLILLNILGLDHPLHAEFCVNLERYS